jgi:RimJ/RimL family protein N-acetyltransferase
MVAVFAVHWNVHWDLSIEMENIVTLETERLRLRAFRDEDIDAYAEINADPEVMRYLTGKPMSRAEAWRHMAMMVGHWVLRGYGCWAVEERETGTLVGRIGFNDPAGWPGFEIGWTLGRPYWGRGYAIEGARAALDYAFNELDKAHVISLIHPENRGSIAVAEKLGEKLEGETEVLGIPVLIYGIDRPEA